MPPDRLPAGSACAHSGQAWARSDACGSNPRRGLGIARALMAAVEDAARDLDLTDLRLGTGDRQPEAVALYASAGWERVFVGHDARPVPDRHIWFAKHLRPS